MVVDASCTPLPFENLKTDAVARLVIHHEDETDHGLADQLKRAEVDERITGLNQFGSTSSRVIAGAAERGRGYFQ
ncbi:hypothetical protein [Bradyrhizobium genosp. P]|uniref:hypothetical protein n=1 Tax=Bradyrhizobium genosp. P TaxID=83641 RepID=UPI003CEC1174